MQILLPVCSALVASHAQGIVHRDVKPDNIILLPTETGLILPKLVDFGIATLGTEEGVRRLTKVGECVGTPEYMSPEQLAAEKDVDGRTDVWSLAVVLYQCVAGPPPFEASTYAALASTVLRDEPRPLTDFGAGDVALWNIVERGLAKDLDERWPSMRSFGMALARWADARGVETDVAGGSLKAQWLNEGSLPGNPSQPPPSGSSPAAGLPRRRSKLRIGATAAAALAVTTIGVWLGARFEPTPSAPGPAQKASATTPAPLAVEPPSATGAATPEPRAEPQAALAATAVSAAGPGPAASALETSVARTPAPPVRRSGPEAAPPAKSPPVAASATSAGAAPSSAKSSPTHDKKPPKPPAPPKGPVPINPGF